MPRRLIAASLALILLALINTAHALAEDRSGLQIVSAHTTPAGWIEIFASCPIADTGDFTITIDGGPATAPQEITSVYAPPALALVVERSPAQLAQQPDPGAPASALGQIEQLLAELPVGSLVSVISYGEHVSLLAPLSGDRAGALAALAADLAQPATSQPASGRLAEAIALGHAQIATAPPGPQALVILATDGPPTSEPLPELREAPPTITLVGLSPSSETGLRASAETLGARYLPAYSQGERAAPQVHYAAITTPAHLLRLLITSPNLLPGRHHLALSGCGGTDARWIRNEAPAFSWQLLVLSGLGGLLLGLPTGYAVARSRKRAGAPAAQRGVSGYTPGADGPTERGARRTNKTSQPRYRLVAWVGQRRISHELHERQCVIGCSPGCDLQIHAPQIADLHARITSANDQVSLVDLDSASGTSLGLGGPRLKAHQPVTLQEGDEFWLGPEVRVALRRSEQEA
ncbi:MAG: FHA domain-containing protein [Oscillochloris sp.]|nr:FHA domain-containing protein [Oscillochloris sp.]